MTADREEWTATRSAALVTIASICFATSGPLAYVAKPAHPLVTAAGRTLVAAIVLFAVAPGRTLRDLCALPRRRALAVVAAGALLAAHFGLFLAGLAATSLPAAVTLVSLEPVAVVLTAWATFGARPKKLEGGGVFLATIGAVVLSRGAGQGEHHASGDLLVLGAVALYGAYVAAARAIGDSLAPNVYATAVYGSSGVLLTLASLAVSADFSLSSRSLLAIAALGLVPTLGGHTLVQWSARHVAPSVVALVSPGETLGSLVLAAALLGQSPSGPELAGALLVLSGACVVILAQRA